MILCAEDKALQPVDIDKHLDDMAALSATLPGCLSVREVRFLALAAATLPPSLGEVLEIGCFKGKSTTVLAKSVSLAGGDRVVAVDPLTLPASTDPAIETGVSLPDVFRNTLATNDVEDLVEFHQMLSQELATTWDRPLRFLWVDGDHTYIGAKTDFDSFAQHLRPGAVVALHDVLHPAEGPIRTFCEQVLLSSSFGACGLCGSIGWAQYVGPGAQSAAQTERHITLFRKLSRLIQFVALGRTPKSTNPLRYKILRPLVPHFEMKPNTWKKAVVGNLLAESNP